MKMMDEELEAEEAIQFYRIIHCVLQSGVNSVIVFLNDRGEMEAHAVTPGNIHGFSKYIKIENQSLDHS